MAAGPVMPKISDDVRRRLDRDFPDAERVQAESVLLDMNARLSALMHDDLEDHPRISRCVVHVAEGDLPRLKEAAELACTDWRDVIMWAEYDRDGTRLHDFTVPFA
jgi:hypothetical protein